MPKVKKTKIKKNIKKKVVKKKSAKKIVESKKTETLDLKLVINMIGKIKLIRSSHCLIWS